MWTINQEVKGTWNWRIPNRSDNGIQVCILYESYAQDNIICISIICSLKVSSASLQIQPISPALQVPYDGVRHPCSVELYFQCQPSHHSADILPPCEVSRMDLSRSPIRTILPSVQLTSYSTTHSVSSLGLNSNSTQ